MWNIIWSLPVNVWVSSIALTATGLLFVNMDSRPVTVHRGTCAMSMNCSPMIQTRAVSVTNVGLNQTGGERGGTLNSKMANLLEIQLLEMGLTKISDVKEYRCSFLKQERIAGHLTDMQEINLKVKQAPFSVYMQWVTCMEGREVLYVDGEHENQMLVHLEGVQGKLTGTMKLDPEGMLAMREARHPITEVGIKNLIEQILTYRRKESQSTIGHTCFCQDNQVVYNKKCILFVTEYTSPDVNPDYRKSMVYIDVDNYLPVCVKNFGWPETEDDSQMTAQQLDDETLLEHYAYLKTTFDAPMIAGDFDPHNTSYHFH